MSKPFIYPTQMSVVSRLIWFEALTVRRWEGSSNAVSRPSSIFEFLHEGDEVLLVGSGSVPITRSRIFPVNVDTIEVVCLESVGRNPLRHDAAYLRA